MTFTEDDRIDAEHIFTGPKAQSLPFEYNLTPNQPIQWLIQRSSLRLLRGILLAVFSAIIVCCLAAGASLTGRVANTLVWAAWWPGILSAVPCGEAKFGPRLRIMALLFLIIMTTEHVFHMTRTPYATGIILLCLMSMPVFLGLSFQRETWCRYLCPLGSLAASYSVSSTVQIHANPNVCASQ